MNTAIRSTAVAIAAAFAVAPSARASDAGSSGVPAAGFFERIADRLHAPPAGSRDTAAIAVAHPAQLAPPVPVAVTWRPQKLAPSLDLGAPLLALAAADLDGDGKAELYAVTTREVIALAVGGGRVRELGRVAFAGDLAPRPPRDPVGSAIAVRRGGKLVVAASASSFARALDVTWRNKALAGDPGKPGFELCADDVAQLAPGRDYFGDGAAASYGWRCRDDLAGADGHALRVRAQLSLAGKLDVALDRCDAAGACAHAADYSYPKAGIGFELVDLDRDGTPEVAFGGAGAPGDPDELRVFTLGEDEHKAKWKKAFTAGGIVAIASGDLDGKGAPALIAAVRLVGSTRVDLWRMN